MFERIVVGTDGSDTATAAVAEAVGIASRIGGEVLVVGAHAAKGRDDPAALARSVLRDVRRLFPATRTEARPGDPADALLGAAREHDADLLVVGNRGIAAKPRLRLGSVAERVSHRAACSVLVAQTGWAVMPSEEELADVAIPGRILIATDGSDTADVALRQGMELARALKADSLVLHVGDESRGRQVLARAVERFGEDLRTVSVQGEPSARILEVADEASCDLIVVGNKGMSGVRRLLGGVPNEVVHNAGCGVLIVKTT